MTTLVDGIARQQTKNQQQLVEAELTLLALEVILAQTEERIDLTRLSIEQLKAERDRLGKQTA